MAKSHDGILFGHQKEQACSEERFCRTCCQIKTGKGQKNVQCIKLRFLKTHNHKISLNRPTRKWQQCLPLCENSSDTEMRDSYFPCISLVPAVFLVIQNNTNVLGRTKINKYGKDTEVGTEQSMWSNFGYYCYFKHKYIQEKKNLILFLSLKC